MAHLFGAQLQLCRSLESVFDEAQFTGFLQLSGLNLTRFPDCYCKYDLTDTVTIDLSHNRFQQLDQLICEFAFIESLNLAHNQLYELSNGFQWLERLSFLDLSGNKLRNFPVVLCFLPLEILLLSHNHIEILPSEIAHLKESLTELDLSGNPLISVPCELGYLTKLRVLKLRKCRLSQLPADLFSLTNLRELDVSSNCITHLPKVENIRTIANLIHLNVSSNPLISPPIKTCRFGAVHILKKLYQRSPSGKQLVKRQDSDITPEAEMPESLRQDSRDSGFIDAEINSFKPKKSLITNGKSQIESSLVQSSPVLTNRRKPHLCFSQSPFVNEILTAVWEQTDSVEKSVGKLEFSEASEKSRISQSISTESQLIDSISKVNGELTIDPTKIDSIVNCSNVDIRVSPRLLIADCQSFTAEDNEMSSEIDSTSIPTPISHTYPSKVDSVDFRGELELGWIFAVFGLFWTFLSVLILLFAGPT